MAKLPPTPVGVPPGHSYWNDWYEKLRDFIDNAVQFFSDLDFTGSNITSIATRNHNDLQSFQGGASNDYYHLTGAQHTALTAGFTGTGNVVRATAPALSAPTLTGMTTGTGTATATLTANKPGANTGVSTWVTININGVNYYLPAWT